MVLGLTLLGYAVNVFIFAMGRLWCGAPPILGVGERLADPLPQALVLTAIVIGFAMTGFVIELALRSRHETAATRSTRGPTARSRAHEVPRRLMQGLRRERLAAHLPVLPVLLPSLTAVLLLLIGDQGGDPHGGHGHRRLLWARRLSLGSTALGLLLAAWLVRESASGGLLVYRLGDWPAPYGIVLVVDRLRRADAAADLAGRAAGAGVRLRRLGRAWALLPCRSSSSS